MHYFDGFNMERHGLVSLEWVRRGTQDFFSIADVSHRRTDIAGYVRRNNLPTIQYLEQFGLLENQQFVFMFARTIIEFIHSEFGMEYVVEMNRRHGDFQGIFRISRDEFERQWHAWLRVNYR
jgi:hypothetical protein